MDEAIVRRSGPIEGTSRILRELLRTPNFKKTVRMLLSELDPENTALLVRTLMWEDPELFLSVIGAAPSLINVVIEGTRELGVQMSNFPSPLLAGFLAGAIEQVNAEFLGEAIGLTIALAVRIEALDDEALRAAASRFWERLGGGIAKSLSAGETRGEGTAGLLLDAMMPMLGSAVSRLGSQAMSEGSEARRLVKGLAEGMRTIAGENPEFIKAVVLPLVEAGREALAQAERAEEGEGEGG